MPRSGQQAWSCVLTGQKGQRVLSGAPFIRVLIPHGPHPGDTIASQRPRHLTDNLPSGVGFQRPNSVVTQSLSTARAEGEFVPTLRKHGISGRQVCGHVTDGSNVSGRGPSLSLAPPMPTRGPHRCADTPNRVFPTFHPDLAFQTTS